MLTLQNVFTAFLLAFAAILAAVSLVVLGHSIGSAIEQDYVNMGILKTMGFTIRRLRELQLLQYLTGIVPGLAGGLLLSLPAAKVICRMTVTTTGLLIPSNLPTGLCLLTLAVLLLLLIGFIWLKTDRIRRISPMQAIRDGAGGFAAVKGGKSLLRKKGLGFWLALRQFLTGKKRYLGAALVALLLVFFASMIGRVNAWLGPNGEGLMDAFNPADLHIAAQPMGEATSEDVEQLIRGYTGITDQYMLAMPSVSAQGVDYTANVITQPERFHMLAGRACENPDEVVLTEFAAADLGVSVGDTITLTGNLGSSEFTVSGIYQCANDMGANLGLSREGYNRISAEGANIWCIHYFLEDESLQPGDHAGLGGNLRRGRLSARKFLAGALRNPVRHAPFDDLSLCHCADFRSGNHYADHKQAAGSRTKGLRYFQSHWLYRQAAPSFFCPAFWNCSGTGKRFGNHTQRFPHRPAGGSA